MLSIVGPRPLEIIIAVPPPVTDFPTRRPLVKGMVQKLVQRLRRLASPLRGAVHRVLDHHIQLWLSRTEPARAEQERASGEMLLVADAMVRELVRLQNQLQALEQAIVEQATEHDAPPSVERREAA